MSDQPTKTMLIGDFLTDDEIAKATKLYQQLQAEQRLHHFATQFCNEVTKPNIERINTAVGQACDPKYLAYCVEYVLQQATKS